MTGRLLPFRSAEREPMRKGADPHASLAQGVRDGKDEATRTLIVSVMPALLRAARSVLGVSHQEIEDVAQEAALGLINALPHFRHECSVAHFATRICVRTALSARRKLQVRGEGKHVELDEGLTGDSQSPSDVLLASYRRQILRELCDELPEQQGEALVLHCVMGLTVDEVAAVSQAPRNTVRSRLRLAKESLRSRIEGDRRLNDVLGGQR